MERLGLDYVYIETPKEVEESKIIEFTREEKLSKCYKSSIGSFQGLFSDLKMGNAAAFEEVKDVVLPLVKSVVEDNNILGSLRMMETNDEYTYRHSINVSLISSMIGKWLGYSDTELFGLSQAALFHDIGKSKIPSGILNKPSKLTTEEFEIMKNHSKYSYEIVKSTGETNFDILFGVLEHHEKVNGRGYPNGSGGDKIHEFARIIAVADVYDALTSNRIYKSKISPYKVAEMLMEESGAHLDPSIVQLFLRNIARFYVGNVVRLNSGDIGEVIMVNKYNFTRPLIKVHNDFHDLSTNYELEIVEVVR